MSASSLTSLPSSVLDVSNKEKKPSMSSVAPMLEVRKLETLVRNSRSLVWSLRKRLEARSITAVWRIRRACSWGETAGPSATRLRLCSSSTGVDCAGGLRAGVAFPERGGARTG